MFQTDGTTWAFKALKFPCVLWEKNGLETHSENFSIGHPLLGKSQEGQDECMGYHCIPLWWLKLEYRKPRERCNVEAPEELALAQSIFSWAHCPATQGTTEARSCPELWRCQTSTGTNRADPETCPLASLNPNFFTMTQQNRFGVFTLNSALLLMAQCLERITRG